MKMNREKRNRSTEDGSSVIKTKSLRPSSGVTAHGRRRDGGEDRERGGGGSSNNTMVKQYKALFLQNPPKWKKIYIHNIKKEKKKIFPC